MKKALVSLFTVLVLMSFTQQYVNALVWGKEVQVIESRKMWGINFSDIIDKNSINENSVYIVKVGDGSKLELEYNYMNYDKTLTAKPIEEYEENKLYTLVIEDTVKSINGVPIKEQIALNFKYIPYEVLNIEDIE